MNDWFVHAVFASILFGLGVAQGYAWEANHIEQEYQNLLLGYPAAAKAACQKWPKTSCEAFLKIQIKGDPQ